VRTCSFFLCASAIVAIATVAEAKPSDVVRNHIDSVAATKGKATAERRVEVINSLFRFDTMARDSFGHDLDKATAETREEVFRVFVELVRLEYDAVLASIGSYDIVAEMQTDEDRTLVLVKVNPRGKVSLDIVYVFDDDDLSRVTDVIIDDLGAVAKYKKLVHNAFKKSGSKGVLRALEERRRNIVKASRRDP
jgi:ABC-type transporter MlaC component